jgi:hypothetical protein
MKNKPRAKLDGDRDVENVTDGWPLVRYRIGDDSIVATNGKDPDHRVKLSRVVREIGAALVYLEHRAGGGE